MNVRIRHLRELLSTGYWFVPTVMTIAAGAIAWATLYLDRYYLGTNVAWLYSGGADGARTLLSTVAGSTITVAGVVFSITIAALTQASAQLGPRLLRNFMRDRGNQVVLGTFVATFLYCLLVLRTIHGKLDVGEAFVPQASVTGAVILAAASIAVLIYFIHHVSISLQAPSVVAAVRHDFHRTLRDLHADLERDPDPDAVRDQVEGRRRGEPACVVARTDGYLQAVDYPQLVEVARANDLLIVVEPRPGDYVIEGTTIARAWPATRCDASALRKLQVCLIYGDRRTPEQDVEFAIKQIVEVAVRALSPGINDPFTAINCIDSLASALAQVARSGLPRAARRDAQGIIRVLTTTTTFEGLVDAAFSQIRQYGASSVAVTLRLLEAIRSLAEVTTSEGQRAALLRHARMVYEQSQDATLIRQAGDRADAVERWEAATRAFAAAVGSPP